MINIYENLGDLFASSYVIVVSIIKYQVFCCVHFVNGTLLDYMTCKILLYVKAVDFYQI